MNKDSLTVIDCNGVVQGPYLHFEWLNFSWFLWDQFHEVLDSTVELTDEKAHNLWATLFFRNPDDFVAGNYNYFSEIHLLLANAFPDLDSKHKSYSECHAGADLWGNLLPTDIHEAKQCRNTGKIFNVSVQHESNSKIRGALIPEK